MTAFALAVPAAKEDQLVREALAHGHEVVLRTSSSGDLIDRLAASGAEVALVDAAPRYLDVTVVAECDPRGVRIVALANDAAEAARATSLGVSCAEYSGGFAAILHATAELTAPRAERAGRVIAVWGPAGAPGRTTLAIALAAELAQAAPSVALVDADTYHASIATALSLLDEAPGIAAAARLTRTDALTSAELDRIGQIHDTPLAPLRVLTGISRSGRWPELGGERVAAVLGACRAWAEYTVVDVASSLERDEEISSDLFSPRRNAATIAALQAADTVIAVCAGDPVGLTRTLRAHGDLVDVVEHSRVKLVVNKVRASAMGIAPKAQVEQTLARFGGLTASHYLPYDRQAADAALLAGRTLAEVAPRSALRKSVQQLAQSLLPVSEQTTRRARRASEAKAAKQRAG